MRAQQTFKVTTVLEVLFAFTLFLDPVSAAPQRLSQVDLARRANNVPGIGVELEIGGFQIIAKNSFTDEQLEKIKGHEIIPVDFDGGKKTSWQLTAEIGSGREALIPEAIVNGLQNKVGAHQTGPIGQEVFDFMKNWAPKRPDEVKIPGFEDLGPFTIKWPKDQPRDAEKISWSPQVTAAMPLAAVLDILRESTKDGSSNPLASTGNINKKKFKILTKENFASFQKIKQSDVTDDFLGYFSLLATYCVVANFGVPKEGPKRLVNIMPRTDFTTQYKKFVEPKLTEQLKDNSLYDIVKKVTDSKDGFDKEVFKWIGNKDAKIDEDWTGKAGDLESGTLEVGKFLNYLPRMDLVKLMDKALRHGQVGGLGDKMEDMLDTTRPVPIFEFRDLNPIIGVKLKDVMGSYEDKVIDYHHQFANGENVNDKPSKRKSLSIVMREAISAHGTWADVSNWWEFYTISVGKAVGSCGETDGEKLTPNGPTDPAMSKDVSISNPPWPAGTFKLKIEGQDCEYKCDGTNPGKLFCPSKQITCVEDSAKSKKDYTKCGNNLYMHATVVCDF